MYTYYIGNGRLQKKRNKQRKSKGILTGTTKKKQKYETNKLHKSLSVVFHRKRRRSNIRSRSRDNICILNQTIYACCACAN